MLKNKKIVVFASGSGTNFINIHKNVQNGKIVLLISNNPNSGAVRYAAKNQIPFKIINDFRYPNINIKNIEYEVVLNHYKPDLILLAGFMKKIPSNIIALYLNKIMNIHPSLLPKYGGKGYYGIKVHEAVVSSKDRITGATVHFVNDEYDRGPIIKQYKINVNKTDDALSLSKRVLKVEYSLYLDVVNSFCLDKIKINNTEVIINE
tara:strand:+ start:7519 stop:8136 length:618 start_codon:yes stop_codon:yes gene_type:complete